MAKALDHEMIVTAAGSRAGVSISRDDLLKIRGCRPESALGRWIEKNLTTATLLSSEELKISEAISEYGSNSKRPVVGSVSGPEPLSEDELLAAITDLNTSTEALNRHSRALEAQKGLVECRYDGNSQTETQHGSRESIDEIEQRNTASIQRLKGDIHELQDEIERLLQIAREAIEKSSKEIPSIIFEITNGNDRALADLTRQHSIGTSTDAAMSTTLDTVERLAASLSKMIAEELHIRLDRTYLENLQQSAKYHVESDQPTATEDARSLEDDLHSLYREIPDVAEIFVAQKYKDPLVAAIHEEERQRAAVASLHAQQVSSQISNMTADLDEFTKRLHEFHSYRSVIQSLQADYDHFNASSSIETFTSTKKTPRRPREAAPALESLLRHFCLSAVSSGDTQELIAGRIVRLRESGRSSVDTITRNAKTTVEARKKVIESLLQGIDQCDEGSLARLTVLEARITSLREDVEAVSGADRAQESRKQGAFVQRWS